MAMADGISDKRDLVREAASKALVAAVLDRHSSAVPPGVLVNVLGDIVIPVVNYIGQQVLERRPQSSRDGDSVAAAEQPPVGPPQLPHHLLQRNWMRVELRDSAVQEKEVPDTDLDNSASAGCVRSDEGQGALSHIDLELEMFRNCLAGLTSSFIRHLKRIASFPSFDKLWLRFFELLVYFAHCTEHVGVGGDRSADGCGIYHHCERGLEDISVENIRVLLQALVAERTFDHREGLRTVTVDMMRGTTRCRGLVEEIGI